MYLLQVAAKRYISAGVFSFFSNMCNTDSQCVTGVK